VKVKPQGAFYIYSDCEAITQDAFQWCSDLLENTGVALTPGKDFGDYRAQQHIRFAYTRPIDELEEAVKRIRGPKGTKVTLTIFREDWQETKDIEIERGVIQVPSLKWELKENNIAYIRIYQFSEGAASDFQAAAIEILESPAQKIVLALFICSAKCLLVNSPISKMASLPRKSATDVFRILPFLYVSFIHSATTTSVGNKILELP